MSGIARIASGLALAACLVAGASALAAGAPDQPAVAAVPAAKAAAFPEPTAAERELGVQVLRMVVTAQGGLVDVRFRVVDGPKATKLLGVATNAPTLAVGDLPPLHAPQHTLKGGRFPQGAVFMILYPNLRNSVTPGAEVSVQFGDHKVGPYTAQ